MDPLTLSSGIRSTSALPLFSSVLSQVDHSIATTCVQGVDDLLHLQGGVRRGDVIEIQGLACTGKTTLLLHLTMISILHRSIYHSSSGKQIPIGGKQHQVCFIDCSAQNRFPFPRLVHLLTVHFKACLIAVETNPENGLIDQLIKEACSRLIVFRPKGLIELTATIKKVSNLFTCVDETDPPQDDNDSDKGMSTPFHLIDRALLGHLMIDGMSEFGWSHQLELEGKNLHPLPAPTIMSHLISSIAELRTSLAPVIYITQWVFNPSLVPAYSKDRLPLYKSHLEPPWPRLTTIPIPSNLKEALLGPDPLDPLSQPHHPERPSFPIHHHLTLHPPRKRKIKKGVPFQEVWERRKEGRGEGMDGFVCVLRSGGKEVGSWEWSVEEDRVVC
ncbi:BQ2448_3594 [Microbotryum intermedium]|uniref:BQ2448_3594 protein n=1 Tax=Microbotryum intermedium TaxID=269621 RepID=A0A238FAF4_9BASI|nr:BQ2448_3594 [Microbotryum intermedium]